MDHSCRIILAATSGLFRRRLRRIIERKPDLHIVAEVWEGFGLLSHVRHDTEGRLMLVFVPPSQDVPWTEAIGKIKNDRPGTNVLVVGAFDDLEYVTMALDAGADGYVAKENVDRQLIRAIETIGAGERYFAVDIGRTHRARPVASAG